MMKKLGVLALLIIAALFKISAAEVSFSGDLKTAGSVTFPYTKEPWKVLDMGAGLDGKLDVYSDYGSAHVDAEVSYSLPTERSGKNVFDLVCAKENFGFKLKEAYYEFYGSFWGFKVGRQIVTWGAADSLILTNVICPSDSTKLTSENVSESKLGIDAVKLSFNTSSVLFDAYWIPFFTPSALPLDETNPLRSVLIPSSVQYGGYNFDVNPITYKNISLPDVNLKNGEYGARLSCFTSALDFSFYGFYGWDDEPVVTYEINPSDYSINLKGSYQRMAMVGADASVPVGEVTVRVETAFYPQRAFTTDTAFEKHNELSFLGGFDWMKDDWTVTAQYYGDYKFGDLTNLSRKRSYEQKGTLSISKDFLDGNLSASVAAIAGLTDWDSAITGSVSYSLSDELTLKLSSVFFNKGKNEGTYGKYKDLSFVCFKGTYSF